MFLPVAALPEDQWLSWGWRVPFWASVAVAVVGYVIRRTLQETPAFTQQAASEGVPELPLLVLLREHWADVLRVVAGALIASVSTIFTVWALAYGTSDSVGLSRTQMLWVGALAEHRRPRRDPRLGHALRPHRPPSGLPDRRRGQRRADVRLPVGHLDRLIVLLFGILAFGVVYSAANGGAWPSFYGEMFSTRVRLSGTAIGTQIGFAVAAVTFAAQIAGPGGDDWSSVALFMRRCVLRRFRRAHRPRDAHGADGEELGERVVPRTPRSARP